MKEKMTIIDKIFTELSKEEWDIYLDTIKMADRINVQRLMVNSFLIGKEEALQIKEKK